VRHRLESELLLEAFIRTARRFQGSADRIVEYAQIAADLARGGLLRFDADEVTDFVAGMNHVGFPAVHHSGASRAGYRRGYRVLRVMSSLWTSSQQPNNSLKPWETTRILD